MATDEEFVLDLTKMKIADLKRELQIRNLKVSGNKQDLIQRLQQYLEEHEGAEVEDDGSILEEEEEEQAAALPDSDPEKSTVEPGIEEKDESNEVKSDKIEAKEAEVKKANEVSEKPKELTDEEKKAARAQKFGLKTHELSDADRKLNRSKRFGTAGDTNTTGADTDKLKQRAARFGAVVSGTLASKEDEERKRKRLERFGNISQNDTPEVSEKKKKRAERFGISVA